MVTESSRTAPPAATAQPAADAVWIEVGRIGRPHGVQGAVHLQLFHPNSELWLEPPQLRAHLPGKPAFFLTIEDLRPTGRDLIARFVGVGDRAGAVALTHVTVSVDQRVLPATGEDEIYLHELVGAKVFSSEDQSHIGVITSILQTNVDILVIALHGGGEALVPVNAEAIVSLGREPGKVVIANIDDWKST